jgi:putative ABC transport system ATP-binding protein
MLDQERGKAIVELLAAQCREHQVAALMVTHDNDMVKAASKVMHIRDGHLTQEH